MDSLLWGLLGFVVFPLWLLAGLLDYWAHQRTSIATTTGTPEALLHVAQMAQVGIPVLVALFIEMNLLALTLVAASVVAHTATAYWDIRYTNSRRPILPAEQLAHAFLITLPLFGLALLAVLHWPVLHAASFDPAPGDPWLQLRREPWDASLVVLILGGAVLFGIIPGLIEFTQALKAGRIPRKG